MRAFEFSTYDQMLDGLSFMADSCADATIQYTDKADHRTAALWADAERAINMAIQSANMAKDQYDARGAGRRERSR